MDIKSDTSVVESTQARVSNIDQQPHKSIFNKLWFRITLGVLGLVVGIGILASFGSPGKVSQEFIDKYNETAALFSQTGEALGYFDKNALDQKENAKDYPGAVKIVDETQAKISEAIGKIELIKTRLKELRDLTPQISDQQAKEKSIALITAYEEGVIHLEKLLNNVKEILALLRSYYSDLAAGKTPAIPKELESITAETESETIVLKKVGDKMTKTRDEFFKAAELTIIEPSKIP